MRAGTLVIAGAMISAAVAFGSGGAAAQPAEAMPEDGIYLVGVDIQPGIWEAPGTPDPATGCDWRRLWAVDGEHTEMNHIIANNYTREHPVRVTIEPTDFAFDTANCGPWRLVPPPASSGSAGS